MEEIKQESERALRAYLVGIQNGDWNMAEAQDHLAELTSLAETLGLELAGSQVARISRPSPHFYLGQGKAEEIKALTLAEEADVVIIDVELSPSQQRNWEKFTELSVIDRQEVILNIFARRARTREARLQVELAQYEYMLPRLRHAWSHLERQRGGAGLRGGPGELQLEVDRRRIQSRIAHSKEQLRTIRRQREVRRKSRQGRPVPGAAIVGYTNVGKSSLLKRLTGADVFIEDKLFATLDTTTRRITLPNNQPLLLTDTVGFIRKLPHQLVESFKATLEEAVEADFLVQVLDVTHPKIEEHYRVTMDVLAELGAADKPMIVALNKIDLPYDPFVIGQIRNRHSLSFPVSTRTGEGIDALLAAFAEHFVLPMRRYALHIPHNRFDLVDLLHREGEILEERHDADGVWISAIFPTRFEKAVEPFLAAAQTE